MESSPSWVMLAVIIALFGMVLMIAPAENRLLKPAGAAFVTLSIFITPAIWSVYTALNPGRNLSLPAAYSGSESSPTNKGNVSVNQTLLDFLEANTQDVVYLVVVPTSMQGSDFVLASGRPVLYASGFKGNDEVVTAGALAQMAANGEIRYLYWSPRGNGSISEISNWVSSACVPVEGFDIVTRNSGAPDGTSMNTGLPSSTSPGNQSITLYDCKVQ